MKKQAVILLFMFLSIGGWGLRAQKVTKIFTATPLKTVLKEIEQQTGFSIVYKTDEISESKPIDANFQNVDLKVVLKQILGENLDFSLENKMIVIYKRGTNPASLSPVKAKTKQVSGVVTDSSGEPLIGVSVKVKGTTNGIMTDLDGAFQLKNVPENGELEFSYIGMQAQSVSVSGRNVFNVSLQEDSKVLEEVVVTAMGIERKAKSLTYATQKMDNEELMRVQDANFINSLQGKAAGLSITPSVGGAGGASKIILRGNKSVLGNNAPLIVVDGIPMNNAVSSRVSDGLSLDYSSNSEGADALSSLNPDDIENINILKGANAAALYGSLASNGVLVITTKKGREGTLSVNVSSNATFEAPLLLPQLQNLYGPEVNPVSNSISLGSWGKRISEMTAEELAIKNLTSSPQNYVSDFFNVGSVLNNSVSIAGGTKNIRNYFSYGNTLSNGMIANNTFVRHNFAFRQSYNLFKERLKIDMSVNYLNQTTRNRPGGGKVMNPLFDLYTAPRNIDMNYYRQNYKIEDATWNSHPQGVYVPKGASWVYDPNIVVKLKGPKQHWFTESASHNNPYWLINMNQSENIQERVYGYLSGNVRLLEGLSLQGRLSMDVSRTDGISKRYATTQNVATYEDFGVYYQGDSQRQEVYLDWMLNYNKELGDFSVSASTGYTGNRSVSTGYTIYTPATIGHGDRRKPSTEVNIFDFRAGLEGGRNSTIDIDWAEGAFFTGQLGYRDMVYLEGSYRQDWYRAFKQFSRLGLPDNYGYFSMGANALLHSMLKLPDFWNHMKLRISYSEVGNSIPDKAYHFAKKNFRTGAVELSPWAEFKTPIPEKTRSIEGGFDASFFNNALNWDLTLYHSVLQNAYMEVTAGTKIRPVNSSAIRNMGIENSISYALNLTRNLMWKTGLNFSYNDNKILEAYTDPTTGAKFYHTQSIGWGGKIQIKYKEGGSYGDMYATDFARNSDGSLKLNPNGSPIRDNESYGRFIGNMNAPWLLGWNNTFTYKGLSLYFLIDGKIGGKVVSFTEAYLDYNGLSPRSAAPRLLYEQDPAGLTYTYVDPQSGATISLPGMRLPDGQLTSIRNYFMALGGDAPFSSEYVYDATNFRLRELSLGYTFKDLFGASKNLSLSLIGRNLFFLYNKAPIDPDASLSSANGLGSVDFFNMPTSRSLGLSCTLTF